MLASAFLHYSQQNQMSLSNRRKERPSGASSQDGARGCWQRSTEVEDNRALKKARITPEFGPVTEFNNTQSGEDTSDDCGAPFFHYKDFSQEKDPDPLTPLTPPGRVPNFPAKMHAILSHPGLTDVVAWMPHGRSWRVLKPREFETSVIPTYFEHSKFSSFIRQANGWGFRRITQGRDRNSYYHERFLRGLPYLCKQMKRPGVAEKGSTDVDREPDFYKISELYPVPVKADDESILLPCTVQGGPKARMPIYSGAYLSADMIKAIHGEFDSATLTPGDHQSIVSFQSALSNSELQIGGIVEQCHPPQQSHENPMLYFPQAYFNNEKSPPVIMVKTSGQERPLQLVMPNALDRLPFHGMPTQPHTVPNNVIPTPDFAAGFAAATALSNNQFRHYLG